MGASNPNKYYIPFQVQEDVMTISSALSIGIATICVIINLIMRRWYPQACNRVSFRLAALISFMDVGSAAAWLSTWYHRHDPSGDSDYICVLEMFSIVITNLGSAFATGAIAMNLFVLFVLGWDGRRTIEQMYFLAIGVCSAGIAMIGLGLGRYGFNGIECWFVLPNTEDPSAVFAAEWGLLYFWIAVVSVFCAGTAAFVWTVLMRRERLIKELSGDSERSSGTSGPVGPIHVNKQDKAIRFAVARISLYCVVPLISQFFNIALDTMYYVAPTWRYQPLLVLLANLFGGLQGTFNGIVFLIFDPACVATRETIRENLLSKYCLPYVQLPASPATSGQLLDADNDSDMMRSSAAVLEKLPSGIMSTSMASTSQGNVFSQQPQPSAVAFAANHQPPTKTQSPTLSAKQSSRPALSNLSPLKRRSVPNTVEPETSLPHPHIAATSAVSTSSITHTQNAGGGGASANSPGTLAPYNGTLVPHRSTDIILKRLQPVFRRYPPNLLHRTYFWVVWLLCVRQKDYEKYYTGTITNKGSAAKNGERKSRKKKQREAALAAL